MFELVGLDLERRSQVAGQVRGNWLDRAGGPGLDRTARQLRVAWARSQHVMAETRMLAGVMAATEDQVAVTLARMAERTPARAERLRQLSEDARREATQLRDRAQAGGMLAQTTHDVIAADETRKCQHCSAVFIPRREHARFCSSSCRDSWNRQRGGDAVTEASALRWTVTAMRNVNEWLAAAGAQDRSQAFEAISDLVWWVTMVDATLYRHHLQAYESVMHAQPVAERQLMEGILGGLRFARNQMGYHVGQADFIEPAPGRSGGDDGPVTAWSWRSLPEPSLAWLPPRGQAWEMTRYRAYQARLAGHSIGEIFGQAAAFLKLASARATRHA